MTTARTDNHSLAATKALGNIATLQGEAARQRWLERVKRLDQLPGAPTKFKRVAQAPDAEQLGDYLAEFVYALTFVGLGFGVELEPLGRTGPDLRISRDGYAAFVEIFRVRNVNEGPPQVTLSDENFLLHPYGNPEKGTQRIYGKLLAKLGQVKDAVALVAIWNDDEADEELEAEQAVRQLVDDAQQGKIPIPATLLLVVYGSDSVFLSSNQQLYCFPLKPLVDPYRIWAVELEQGRICEFVERATALT